MIDQINIFIVVFFLILIGMGGVILLFISPKVVKETKILLNTYAQEKELKNSEKGLSSLMEELSHTRNKERIEGIKKKIIHKVEEMELNNSSMVQLRQVDMIKKWLEVFSIDQHIKDIQKNGISQQVQFDKKKKDFKLMILKH
ncbi:MAG: hypothetical protein ACRCWI_04920 [Brevinema sp.]